MSGYIGLNSYTPRPNPRFTEHDTTPFFSRQIMGPSYRAYRNGVRNTPFSHGSIPNATRRASESACMMGANKWQLGARRSDGEEHSLILGPENSGVHNTRKLLTEHGYV